jgi:CBS domain-containing protein
VAEALPVAGARSPRNGARNRPDPAARASKADPAHAREVAGRHRLGRGGPDGREIVRQTGAGLARALMGSPAPPAGSDLLLVDHIMTRDVVTARPDMTIQAAAQLMAEHDVSGLPVVDARGRVLGVVSDGDVLGHPRPRRVRRPWWRHLLRDDAGPRRDYRGAGETRVREVMTTPALAVPSGLAAVFAALVLSRRGIRRLPVVDGGRRLIGVVSRGDLVRAMARGAWRSSPELRELLALAAPRPRTAARDAPAARPGRGVSGQGRRRQGEA